MNHRSNRHENESITSTGKNDALLPDTRSLPLDETVNKTQDRPVEYVGPYQLIRCLGEGGMGSVWEASQQEPIKRQVALKLIKAGVGSKEMLTRFEAERQALALMQHPNIAKILDAGSAADGQPYFAMELVKGQRLTEFCDQHQLTIEERMQLFCDVCAGVQHAHQKGIIHRDLKPGNILVSVTDGVPTPKVIDFGLAKALEDQHRLTDQSMLTGAGQILGTLKYMSPEQANMKSFEIDTRADIYSLGVILQELLIGSTPLSAALQEGQSLVDVLQQIREQEPLKPSHQLSQFDDQSLAQIARLRQTDFASLNRILQGDLDWIVVKALENERSRRYESVSGLAADVKRMLNGEPVDARPPSFGYRMRKFVKKNRLAVSAAALVACSLIAAVAGTGWGLVRAKNAEHAEFLRAEGEKKAKAQAENRLAQIETGNRFLKTTFEDLDITSVRQGILPFEAMLAQRLQNVAKQIEGETIGDAIVVADLQDTLGHSLTNLGFGKEAIPILIKARKTHGKILGSNHSDTVLCAHHLASAYLQAGEYDRSIALNEANLKLADSHWGPRHQDTLSIMANLALAYKEAGQIQKAMPLYEDVVLAATAELGPEHPDTLNSANNLAVAYELGGQFGRAIELYQSTLEAMKQQFGHDNPATLNCMNNLSGCFEAAGRLDQALSMNQSALELMKRNLGPDHPNTLTCQNNLAGVLRRMGRFEESGDLYDLTLKARKTRLGPEHPDTLTTMNDMAIILKVNGQLEKALDMTAETVAAAKSKLGKDHPNTLLFMNNHASVLSARGEYKRALPIYEHVFKARQTQLGPEHPETLGIMNDVALAYQRARRLDLAIPMFEETLERTEAIRGADHSTTLTFRNNLALAYSAAGQVDKCIALLGENLTLSTNKLGPDHPDTLKNMGNLAANYRRSGDMDRAMPLFEKCAALTEGSLGPNHPDTLSAIGNLAAGYWSMKRLDKSVPLFEKTHRLCLEKFGPSNPKTLRAAANLGVNYKDAGQLDEGIELLEGVCENFEKYPQFLWVRKQLFDAYVKADRKDDIKLAIDEMILFIETHEQNYLAKASSDLASIAMKLLEYNFFVDAETVLRKCVAIRESLQPEDWTTFNAQSLLGAALLGQTKFQEAKPLLESGYQGLVQKQDAIPAQFRKLRLSEALDRLIKWSEQTGQKEELQKWQDAQKSFD